MYHCESKPLISNFSYPNDGQGTEQKHIYSRPWRTVSCPIKPTKDILQYSSRFVTTSLFSCPSSFYCLGWRLRHPLISQPHSPAETVSSRTGRGATSMSNPLTCFTGPLFKWTRFEKSYLSCLSKYGLCSLKGIRRSSRDKWQVWGLNKL